MGGIRITNERQYQSQEVATMIAGAIEEFKNEFTSAGGSSTRELVQSQLEEFQSQIKQEFQANLAEAMKRQQVQITAASPCVTTPTTPCPGTGSKGFFPTIEAAKKEISRFRMLLDK